MSNLFPLMAAAGYGAAGEATYVEDVFSTYLYEGNGSTKVIENGINLGTANSGGSVEFKRPPQSRLEVDASLTSTGDQTIECWAWMDDSIVTNQSMFGELSAQIYIQNYNSVIYLKYGDFYSYTSIPTSVERSWVHWAVVRNGSNINLYRDGTSILSGTISTNPTINGTFVVGDLGAPTIPYNGYISNLRVSDTARYTANFTPPTSAFTADANTTILLGQGENPLEDQSGNSSTVTVVNSALSSEFGPFTSDTAGKGGLVWIKNRDEAEGHLLADTERGASKALYSNLTSAEDAYAQYGEVDAFNSNGLIVTSGTTDARLVNKSGIDYTSWTFAKQEKFFDVVTYTGTGSAQNISHNLGSVPGFILTKPLSTTGGWGGYHRSLGATKGIFLEETSTEFASTTYWNDTAPTSTEFTVGTHLRTNQSGVTYVAYLFAHNNGDGIFGENGNQDIIKCGSYTGNGSTDGPEIDLGFEPQWVLIKNTSGTGNWVLYDVMRGLPVGTGDVGLFANSSSAEDAGFTNVDPLATGFKLTSTNGNFNTSSSNYIYIAIRRGPMKTPTSGTEVFDVQTYSGSGGSTSPVPLATSSTLLALDALFITSRGQYNKNVFFDRLRNNNSTTAQGGNGLATYSTAAESSLPSDAQGSVQLNKRMYGYEGQQSYWDYSGRTYVNYLFRRAPGFFDVVAWDSAATGDAISHNLGVKPELIIAKIRDQVDGWYVYHKELGATKRLRLDLTAAESTTSNVWNDTEPTASDFTVGGWLSVYDYVAYLFATVPGVSKVGSYTGNGTSQTIDCGFSTGARFVLIKRTDSTSNWNLFDTERGIVAGNDPRLELNTTDAEDTGDDGVDPDSSGFAVNYIATNDDDVNVSGATYIFLAIA